MQPNVRNGYSVMRPNHATNGAAGSGTVTPVGQFPDYRRYPIAYDYVKRGYTILCNNALTLVLVPVAAALSLELLSMAQSGKLQKVWTSLTTQDVQFNLVTFIACSGLLLLVAVLFIFAQAQPVYLLDFAVYRPPDSWKCSRQRFQEGSVACKRFTDVALEFQERILERSGLGEETYLPPAVAQTPPQITMANARAEAEIVMFGAVEAALQATGLQPKQIGIIVVNCSLFNPTPSLAAMIINHFKMSDKIISYNLAGMGCSAGVIAVDLARQLLQVYPNTYALVVSTENITQNWYFGSQRSMLIPNCLFRCGCGAVVLSNRRIDYWRAKYELRHTVRTTMGANDAAYRCIFQMEDEKGEKGVKLEKNLMAVAGEALKNNITTLGPLVLPISEQLLFFFNLVLRKVFKYKIKPYIPDFKLAFDHFCIHTGGRAVIEEIEKQLALSPPLVEPSKATLWRWGNTSSSSLWYILAYIETFEGVRRGDRIWQIGFGSGFKCNSAVWRALRTAKSKHAAWEGYVPGSRIET